MRQYTLAPSNFLSRWLYAWVWDIAVKARSTDIKKLGFALGKTETATFTTDKLEAAWAREKERHPENPQILNALKSAFGVQYALIGIWKLVWALFTWLSAWWLLKMILVYLQNTASPPTGGPPTEVEGHIWAVAIFAASFGSSIAIHQLYGQCYRIGVQIKAALTGLIYRKCLRLSRIRGGAGEVINLLSTDVGRVVEAVTNFHFLWSAFVEATLILILAFYEMGLSAFPALGFVLLLLPVQAIIGRISSRLSTEGTEITTTRVHLMSEILTAIKLIKFYAWEIPFSDRLEEIRAKEMSLIKRNMYLKAFNFMVVFAIPVFVALTCLSVYVFAFNITLTASVSFTVLSVFNTLRYPFLMLPMAVGSTSAAKIAFARISKFLLGDEIEELQPLEPTDANPTAIHIKDSDFRWDGEEKAGPTLDAVDLHVKRGQIVAVIGDVGSGKSSLIAALLGQIRQVRGPKLEIYGTTSYVPQEAWLLNCSLRDNIIFGSPFEREKFDEVIRVCALQRDLTLLVAGEETEIAERGSNLSGGQKQRTSLARAVYNNADTILLDDPLSAVDQAVGRHIFQECFKTHLKEKTVILAIHQLQYLPECDHVVMMKDGKIAMQGTYDELMATQPSFSEMINNHVVSGEDNEEEIVVEPPQPTSKGKNVGSSPVLADEDIENEKAAVNIELNQLSVVDRSQLSIRKDAGDISEKNISSLIERNQLSVVRDAHGNQSGHDIAEIIRKNELTVHSVPDIEPEPSENRPAGQLVQEDKSTEASKNVYLKYARVGRGTLITSLIVSFFFIVHGVRIGSDFWLRLWVPHVGGYSDSVYVGVYAALTFVFAGGVFARGCFWSAETTNKATILHEKMFDAVMHAPMAFFDTTPLGRILSAFSKHQLNIDDSMPNAGMQALQYCPLALGAMILIAATVNWVWAPVIGLAAIGLGLAVFASRAETKLKAAEATTKPAVISHFTASLEGLFSIRSYHAEERFDRDTLDKIDENHKYLLAQLMAKSWIALNLDIIASLMIYFCTLLIVLFRTTPQMPSIAGLALSNALQMLVFLQWTVRMVGEVQGQMSSVGQLVYYGNNVDREAPAEIPGAITNPAWPTTGTIEFKNLVLKYHKFGVAVLKNVSFVINPREKIGIVGRTGSGKSTLLISLLRIVEAHQGQIFIDGLDVSTVGLKDLRTKIAIIPQEPVLFVGTVRTNLDPFNKATDEQIWTALDAVHLGDKIRAFPNGLTTAVIENGKNFSLGQRQLFCIARAVLSNTKILVLDEATAAIDMATDALIQQAIKDNFADKTVLTIAHRLNTIIESDKILVMDAGKVAEFGEPLKLLDKRDGHFKSLVDQTGPATAAKLRDIAVEAKKAKDAKEGAAPQAEPAASSASKGKGKN